ncbi:MULTISPECIES: DeoR/GlpR family DNA-binding transcription regulator [Rhizobium]|uniref:DeoR/GlpR family DNA-binding transcription regulator n=1 Tax=Rhizobium TaxID=379 RepID=UPI0006940CF3|nr:MULTISPECIES: DeoR/GlpR family DNA-binding transcription regulator [Rhizobium]
MNDKDIAQDEDFLPAERRAKIMDWFSANSVASTQDLARRLNASISTIRRDLDLLASEGLLKRTHGGAVRTRQNTTYEQRTEEAKNTSVEEKRAIAKAAASILQPGQSVLIDSKSTSHHLAHAIAELGIPLTVITNDVQVAAILANKDPISVVVPGGSCRHGAYVLLGETSTKFVRELNCDHFFLCTHAVDTTGPTDTSLDLVQLQRAMVNAAMETTLIIDSSKFGSRKIYSVVPIEQIKRIITDEGLAEEDREKYSALVDDLVIAPFLEDFLSQSED